VLRADDGNGFAGSGVLALPPPTNGQARAMLELPRHTRALQLELCQGHGCFQINEVVFWEISQGRAKLIERRLGREESPGEHSSPDGGALASHAAADPQPSADGGALELQLKALVRDQFRAELGAFLVSGSELVLPRPQSPLTSIALVLYNQAELTYKCLCSILAHAGHDCEIIIVDNASTDATPELLQRVHGAIVIHNTENRNFVAACNQASELARGKYLLLLNNDAQLLPGSLQAAVQVLEEDNAVGAVGGRILNLTGRLQEAGSIVWSDGSAAGYGRADACDRPQYMFRREVDFCSAAFLLTRTVLFREVGGFDEVFSPGYYEEVDFCLWLWEHGWRVVYEPRAAIIHFEYGSSDPAFAVTLMARNCQIMRSRHRDYLARREPPDPKNELRARYARAPRLRILFVDDCVPHLDQGTGYPRANAIANAMTRMGVAVTLFPLMRCEEPWQRIYRDLQREIEVIADAPAYSLSAFLKERCGQYDAIFVSRPHNMQHLLEVLRDRSLLNGARLIYDAEAVFALRSQEKARLVGEGKSERAACDVVEELELAAEADEIVCVSESERRHFTERGLGPVHILGHHIEPQPTFNTFEERRDILFVGAMNSPGSPNEDSVLWFSKHVLPHIHTRLASHVRLVVAGQNTVQRLSDPAGDSSVTLAGSVEDLSPYYEQARVFIAPTRFAAGIPLKVLEAAARGVPIVATSLIATQLGWADGKELLTAPPTDPESFADQCVRLYNDKDLWSRLRDHALARVREECSLKRFEEKISTILARCKAPSEQKRTASKYAGWIEAYDTLTDSDRAAIRTRVAMFEHRPLISVIMPTFDAPDKFLREAIESVQRQLYPHWELCVVDNASVDSNVRRILSEVGVEENRLIYALRKESATIRRAFNEGIGLVSGDYIALLNPDDRLSERALYWLAEEINAHPDAQLIYSDSDCLDAGGQRHNPHFKSDWNPDLLLSQNCVGRLAAYRSELFCEIGGFRDGVEGAEDWDLVLRFTRSLEPSRICHVPQILYHRRLGSDSGQPGNSHFDSGWEAGKKAIQSHLHALGIQAEVIPACHGVYHRVRYAVEEPFPLVSIIIPSRDSCGLLRQCLDSIRAKTDYPSYELIIVDNQSTDAATLTYLAELQKSGTARILRYDAPFNWSGIHNLSVPLANGDMVCLLNDDIEVIAAEWLREMVSHVLRPGIGVVGAKLLYGDRTIQHGGVILGVRGLGAGHGHKHLSGDASGYHGRAALVQNISVVTGACMMFRKALFEEVGGMDEWNLPTSYNDVDFCLRFLEKGYRNLWTPYSLMHHHESKTRGPDDTATKRRRAHAELYYFHQKWGQLVGRDPYYNPNLTLEKEDFSLAEPPRTLPYITGTPSRMVG
jgi:GT2 family glycosyltransferase